MCELLKVDFRRVLKDRLFLISCIIGAAFSLVNTLLYVVMEFGMNELSGEMLGSLVTAKAQFFSSFALGNNFGMIAPVLLAIILCKDFGSGTVRNKIISGKSRTSVFLSLFTVCFVCLFGIVLLHALLALGISLIFFEYQAGEFAWVDLGYFFLSLLFEVFAYVFIAALLSYLCALAKNAGLTVVLFVAIDFVLVLVGSILQIGMMVIEQTSGNDTIVRVLDVFQMLNVFQSSAMIGLGTAYSTADILYLTLVPLGLAAAVVALGIVKFRKKDLK